MDVHQAEPYLFGDLRPLLLALICGVRAEGHLLPVQVGLRGLVFGQVFQGQGDFHQFQKFEKIILGPNCRKARKLLKEYSLSLGLDFE